MDWDYIFRVVIILIVMLIATLMYFVVHGVKKYIEARIYTSVVKSELLTRKDEVQDTNVASNFVFNTADGVVSVDIGTYKDVKKPFAVDNSLYFVAGEIEVVVRYESSEKAQTAFTYITQRLAEQNK